MKIATTRLAMTLALILAPAAIPAADVQFEFYDPTGQRLTSASVLAVRGDGAQVKLEPQPAYTLDVTEGEKITFLVSDPAQAFVPANYTVPPNLDQTVHIELVNRTLDDSCLGAELLVVPSGGSVVVSGDTTGTEPDPSMGTFCGTSITTGGLWYVVGGTGGQMTASTCNDAAYDTKISVFCPACGNIATCEGGNDDFADCAGFTSRFSWCSMAGEAYYILVHGFGTAQGAFNLTVSDAGVCTTTPVCMLPDTGPTLAACCFDNCEELGDVLAAIPPGIFDGCVRATCELTTAEQCAELGGTFNENTTCAVNTGMIRRYSSAPAIAIPDNDPAGVTDVIQVPDDFLIIDLDVELNITHTWIGDLQVVLTAPSGDQTVLWNRNCGDSDGLYVTLDDLGTQTSCSTGPGGTTVGSFSPNSLNTGFYNTLFVHMNDNAQGAWRLTVDDNFTSDTGTLDSWELVFVVGEPACTPSCEPAIPCDVTGSCADEDEDSNGSGIDDGIDPGVLTGVGRLGASDGDGIDNGLIQLQRRDRSQPSPSTGQTSKGGARQRISPGGQR